MVSRERGSFWKVLGLSYQLAKTNFKVKNEGSYLGIFWYLLEPLFLFLILIFIRGALRGSGSPEYPIYLLIGLIVFNFFRQASVSSANSINNNANFLKSMKISQESLVLSRIFQSVFSHMFEIILLMVFIIIFGGSLIGLIFYPLVFFFLFLFALGVGFILAIVGTYVNDLVNVWSVLMRMVWFATPIFYIVEKGSLIYNVNMFNPMFYFITITRDFVVYLRVPELWMVFTICCFSVFVFVLGLFVFERFKDKLAEHV